ncbi:hypothetical protein JCM16303_006730 [Sporobolomyces ruberrimus]
MAQSPDTTTLQPIIKRSLSPQAGVTNSALKSPQFASNPPSPNLHTPNHATPAQPSVSPSYFFQSHHGSSTPSSIGGVASGGKDSSGAIPPPTPGILLNKTDSTTIRERPHSPPILHEPLLRVASPGSDSGFSSDGLHSPPPALGSPVTPTQAKPTLDSLVTSGGEIKRTTSPPSPHCHFAPLPKPDERPQSRRSSIVSGRVKPFIPRPPERSDTLSSTTGSSSLLTAPRNTGSLTFSPGVAGGDDEALSTGEYTPSLSPTAPNSFFHPSPSTSSSEHFSALSQRLSSSLTFAAPTPRHPSSPSRPTSRRSSSSRRSRSPSPPGNLSLRTVSSSSAGHHSHQDPRDRTVSTGASSRTHSPNLSRRPSTDALSLHYIEAEGGGGRVVNLSRQNSRAGSERGNNEDGFFLSMASPPLGVGQGGGGGSIRRPQSTERRSTFDIGYRPSASSAATPSTSSSGTPGQTTTPPPPTTTAAPSSTAAVTSTHGLLGLNNGNGMMLVDKDKEADLHRLVEKAQHGNLDAERAVSPALQAQAKRERGRSGERGGEEVEVVEVGRGDLGDEGEELEEVKEEEEEDEGIEEEDEDEDEEEEDEEEGNVESDEEEEPDRSRDEDDDDEEEEEPAEERKTSKGAAVEVVRWHRDDPPPASQTPTLDPTPSIPEDSIAEQEAEEEETAVVGSRASSRRPSEAIFTSTTTDQPSVAAH